MVTKGFEDTVYCTLFKVSLRAKHDTARLAEEYGLTTMQLLTVSSLKPGKAVPMNQISHFLMCDASNVTGLVDRLERHGLIRRQESDSDRRIKTIILTEKGEELYNRINHDMAALQPKSLSGLTAEEFEMLRYLLGKALES